MNFDLELEILLFARIKSSEVWCYEEGKYFYLEFLGT